MTPILLRRSGLYSQLRAAQQLQLGPSTTVRANTSQARGSKITTIPPTLLGTSQPLQRPVPAYVHRQPSYGTPIGTLPKQPVEERAPVVATTAPSTIPHALQRLQHTHVQPQNPSYGIPITQWVLERAAAKEMNPKPKKDLVPPGVSLKEWFNQRAAAKERNAKQQKPSYGIPIRQWILERTAARKMNPRPKKDFIPPGVSLKLWFAVRKGVRTGDAYV